MDVDAIEAKKAREERVDVVVRNVTDIVAQEAFQRFDLATTRRLEHDLNG